MRHAVAASTERACLGHFGAWVDVWVRSGVPAFLERGINLVTNVWHLFEYVAYVFATKKLRSANIESHLSAIKSFRRISRGFELDITHPVITSALKGATGSHAEVGNQATVRWPLSWATRDPFLYLLFLIRKNKRRVDLCCFGTQVARSMQIKTV